MRLSSPVLLAVLFLAGSLPFSLRADYLKNTNLSEGLSGWHGDGDAAFLNPDGTEGNEGDPGVTPVLRIVLSKGSERGVSQDYDTRDNPKSQHARIEVYASKDFKRSKFPNDFSSDINWKAGSTWYWSGDAVPNVDFWIKIAPGFLYKLADLRPGQWVTVDGRWDSPSDVEERTIYFVVPPGEGTVYLKNATVTP